MSEPELQGKSYDIPKRLVWDAWLKVRSNSGAAGADGVTIEQFEERLKDNLYKLWNRMSSGSYFPGPVRAVEIPKKGGTREPESSVSQTWSIGSPKRWRCWCWSRTWSECSTTTPMGTGPGVPLWTRSGHAGSGAGGRIGSLTLM